MRYEKTKGKHLEEPEVVLNLWAYADVDGWILRLAGKAYVMEGDDEEKLKVLRQLSGSDFLSAPWEKVPENFSMTGAPGEPMRGVAHASILSDPAGHSALFARMMDSLAESLPGQLRCIAGNYETFCLELSQDPLSVTTVVIEYEDGRLVPMVSGGQ